MCSEVEEEQQKIKESINHDVEKYKKRFGKIMISLCLMGVLATVIAFILLMVGVFTDNKVCEAIGITLNCFDILMLGVSLIKTMIKFNGYLKKITQRSK